MVKFKQKMGRGQIEVESQDFKGLCKVMDLIGRFPDKCSSCQSDDLHLYHKSPKGNDYYGVRCRYCGAEQAFHQRKEGGFYIKWDDKFEKYGGDDSPKKESTESFESDIPF